MTLHNQWSEICEESSPSNTELQRIRETNSALTKKARYIVICFKASEPFVFCFSAATLCSLIDLRCRVLGAARLQRAASVSQIYHVSVIKLREGLSFPPDHGKARW